MEAMMMGMGGMGMPMPRRQSRQDDMMAAATSRGKNVQYVDHKCLITYPLYSFQDFAWNIEASHACSSRLNQSKKLFYYL